MTREKLNTVKVFVLAITVWSAAIFISPTSEHQTVAITESRRPRAAQAETKLIWLDNYEAALKEARVTGKPIFLEFRCAP
jgi:hypothetical protein